MSTQILRKCSSVGVLRPLVQGIGYERIRLAIQEQLPRQYKNVLAQFYPTSNHFAWVADNSDGDFLPYEEADTVKQKEIKEILPHLLHEVRQALKGTDGAPYSNDILQFPTEHSLYYRESAGGGTEICIAQWGYALYNIPNPPIPPMPWPEEEPPAGYLLSLRYSTGDRISQQEFYWWRTDFTPQKAITDSAGCYDLLQTHLPDGAEANIALTPEANEFIYTFSLNKAEKFHEAVFPLYTSAVLHIKDQSDEAIAEVALSVNGKQETADERGNITLNNIDLGTTPRLIVKAEGSSQEFALSTDPETNHFTVTVHSKRPCSCRLTVQYSDGSIAPQYPIQIEAEGNVSEQDTDSQGQILVDPAVPLKPISFRDMNEPLNSTTVVPEQGEAQAYLTIQKPQVRSETPANVHCSCRLTVRYPDGSIAPRYPIQIETEGEKSAQATDENGRLLVDPAMPLKPICFRDMNEPQNSTTVVPEQGEDQAYLTVQKPQVPLIHFNIIDAKEHPIKGLPVTLFLNKVNSVQKMTDTDGHFAHPKSEFVIGKKVKLSLTSPQAEASKQARTIYKEVRIRAGKDRYTLQLKKRNLKWLWMLLLIPFIALLFLNYHRDVRVMTLLEKGQPCTDAVVEAQFISHYLYKEGKWFARDTLLRSARVDTTGMVVFKNVGMSGFSHVFYIAQKLRLRAESPCFTAVDSLSSHTLHFTLPNHLFKLKMQEKLCSLTVFVQDSDLGKAVPGATLYAHYKQSGEPGTATLKTDTSGMTSITGVPICGAIDSIRVTAAGYKPVIVSNLPVEGLVGSNPNLVIDMVGEVNTIIFTVVDSLTQTPLPESRLRLFANGKEITELTANGNGTFTASVKVNSTLSAQASCDAYIDNNTHIVNVPAQDLLAAPPTDRQIPLSLPKCQVGELGQGTNQGVGFTREFNMGTTSGVFLFEYTTDTAPDRIEVYDCRKDKINSVRPVFTYEGATGAYAWEQARIRITSPIITVRVIGTTAVAIKVNCPE